VPLSICFVVAIASLHFMRILPNRRLPDRAKFPYLHPFTFDPAFDRLNRAIDAYNRLYPCCRAYLVWQDSAISTAVFAVAIVLAELWELAVAK
jgi:hypothetical protein